MNVGPTATKKSVLEQLLDQGMVLVALDARIDGVEVPKHLGRDAQLRLNLSYRFGLPMTVDDWGILATLTFAGEPFDCRFPWPSVFLLVSHVSGQPYLFPDDIPPELLSQATAEAGIDAQIFVGQTPETPASGRPKLQLVRADAADDAPDDDGDSDGDALAAKAGARPEAADAAPTDVDDADGGPGSQPSAAGTTPGAPTRLSHASKVRAPRQAKRSRPMRPPADAETDADGADAPQPVTQPAPVSMPPISGPASTGKGPERDADAASDADDPEPTPPRGRPRKGSHLRVVK